MSYQRYPTALLLCALFILSFTPASTALQFNQQYLNYNLNQNQTATDVSDYAGVWENHTYFPSPSNWRIPFYTLFLDKFVNGDPTNDDINGTMFEHDVM
jgi:alpha-1,3-glucan synthase